MNHQNQNQTALLAMLSTLVAKGAILSEVNFQTGEVRFTLDFAKSNEDMIKEKILDCCRQQQRGGGGLIPAIKLYRELTGMGLGDAKRAVENLAVEAHLGDVYTDDSGRYFRFYGYPTR